MSSRVYRTRSKSTYEQTQAGHYTRNVSVSIGSGDARTGLTSDILGPKVSMYEMHEKLADSPSQLARSRADE